MRKASLSQKSSQNTTWIPTHDRSGGKKGSINRRELHLFRSTIVAVEKVVCPVYLPGLKQL